MASEFGLPGISDLTLIGRGGFGAVYRGHQEALGREVAVKVLNAPGFDDVTQRRFEREQRTLGALSQHPSIVTLHETGVTDTGSPFLVMELMEGGSLSQRLAETGPIPWEEAVRLIIPICEAVGEAHMGGVVHRDIKPDNILISRYGEPKLGDFGIASLADATGTVTTTVTATVEHAAPEVLDGQPPSPASDIYSLGSTLFTLIAGTSPFRRGPDDTMVSILKRVTTEDPPPLDDLPTGLGAILDDCLAKDPDRRPESADDLAGRLRALLGDSPRAAAAVPATGVAATAAASAVGPTRAIPRHLDPEPDHPNRRRMIALVAAILGLLLITLIAFATTRPDPEPIAATSTTGSTNTTQPNTAETAAATAPTTLVTTTAAVPTTTSVASADTMPSTTHGTPATASTTTGGTTTPTTATTTTTQAATTTTTQPATTTTTPATTTTTTKPPNCSPRSPGDSTGLNVEVTPYYGNPSATFTFYVVSGATPNSAIGVEIYPPSGSMIYLSATTTTGGCANLTWSHTGPVGSYDSRSIDHASSRFDWNPFVVSTLSVTMSEPSNRVIWCDASGLTPNGGVQFVLVGPHGFEPVVSELNADSSGFKRLSKTLASGDPSGLYDCTVTDHATSRSRSTSLNI